MERKGSEVRAGLLHTKRDCIMFVGSLSVEHALSAGGCPLGEKKSKKT